VFSCKARKAREDSYSPLRRRGRRDRLSFVYLSQDKPRELNPLRELGVSAVKVISPLPLAVMASWREKTLIMF
jgi:hypothetical protein